MLWNTFGRPGPKVTREKEEEFVIIFFNLSIIWEKFQLHGHHMKFELPKLLTAPAWWAAQIWRYSRRSCVRLNSIYILVWYDLVILDMRHVRALQILTLTIIEMQRKSDKEPAICIIQNTWFLLCLSASTQTLDKNKSPAVSAETTAASCNRIKPDDVTTVSCLQQLRYLIVLFFY